MSKGKWFKKALVLLVVFGMFLAMPLTTTATTVWNAPTQPMEVDHNIIKIANMAATEALPLFLGCNMVMYRQSSWVLGNNIETATALEIYQASRERTYLGIAGSMINANPDPYIWNWFYNTYATVNKLPVTQDAILRALNGVGGSPTSADTYIIPEYGTSAALYRRPEILLGPDPAAANYAYYAQIADLPENKDSNPNNDYNPYMIPYKMGSADVGRFTDYIWTLHAVADAMNDITDKTGKVGRYGDPKIIAQTYEDFVRGIYFYILSELERTDTPKKTVAVINPADTNGDGTFTALGHYSFENRSAQPGHYSEYSDLTTINIVHKLGLEPTTAGGSQYRITIDQLLQADVIIFSAANHSTSTTKETFLTLLVDKYLVDPAKVRNIPIFDRTPLVIFEGITMNSMENAMGIPIVQGFIYGDVIDFNPVYAVAYYYEQLYHVANAEALSNVITSNFANGASLPYGTTTSLSGYIAADFEAKIRTGMAYYEAHEEQYAEQFPWNIDRTIGIGAGGGEGEVVNMTLVSSSVANGATNVPLSGAITFTFSDVVANADTSRVTLKDAQGNAVPINISLTGEGKTVNVAPVSSLQQGKAYTLTINSDLTADNGNTLAVDIVRAFTTIPDNSGGTTDPEDQKSNIWLWVGLIAAVVIILVLLVTRRPAKA